MVLSDSELIARVIERDDRHAFAQLVRQNQSQIRALLRRLTGGDQALADDLAQETFLRAYRGIRTYHGGAKFSSWLYRIAYNVFLTERSRRRLAVSEAHSQVQEETDRTPDAAAKLDVAKAMLALGPQEQLSIALFYGPGATHEEIAAVLECPLGTVKTNIARAKEKLRDRLQAWAPREAS